MLNSKQFPTQTKYYAMLTLKTVPMTQYCFVHFTIGHNKSLSFLEQLFIFTIRCSLYGYHWETDKTKKDSKENENR